MSFLPGIIRGLELGAAALRDTAHVPAARPIESAPLGDDPVDRNVVVSENSYGPHSFALDSVPPVVAPAGEDGLAAAMRDALGPGSSPAEGIDGARVAELLGQYAVPHSPATQNALYGAATLLRDLFGHHSAGSVLPDLTDGNSLRTQDLTGSIVDQSTGRFT